MLIRTVVFVVVLALPGQLFAEPIGTFEWVNDAYFGTGSVFNVTNESNDSFYDVFIDLFVSSAGPTPFQALSLGTIDAGANGQSIDDLSSLLVPGDLDEAVVRFSYLGSLVSARLLVTALNGDSAQLLQGAVGIEPTVQVPEVSSLMLVGLALLGIGLQRRRAPSF